MSASRSIFALLVFCRSTTIAVQPPLASKASTSKETSFLQTAKSNRRCATPTTYQVNSLRKISHVGRPFTQGFEFHDGHLIETSGSFPAGTQSFIRGVSVADGVTLWRTDQGLNGSFIEGITRFGEHNHWFSTVYQEPHRALEFDENFNFVASYPYYFDGWGFTSSPDGSGFLATNGSSYVMELDPVTFQIVKSTRAKCLCQNIPALNELELVQNFQGQGPALIANVYTSRIVLAFDLATMECIGAFNLNGLDEPITEDEPLGFHVANGIAYNPGNNLYYLTGKNWESMFEVELREDSTDNTIDLLDDWLKRPHYAPGILSFLEMA